MIHEELFGITAHRESHQNTDEDIKCQGEATELASGKNTLDNDQCKTVERAAKHQKICERQSQYNEEMVKQTRQAPYKIDDMDAIKIDGVDKTSPVHPNMLFGKIMEIRKDYAKIVTPLKGFISFSRLYPCTSRNVSPDYCAFTRDLLTLHVPER